MSIVASAVFVHVVGVIGFSLTIGVDWIDTGRHFRGAAPEFPWLYRGTLALMVLSGIYLTRGMLQGSSSTARELGWLLISAPALGFVAATGLLRTLRPRVLSVRTALF